MEWFPAVAPFGQYSARFVSNSPASPPTPTRLVKLGLGAQDRTNPRPNWNWMTVSEWLGLKVVRSRRS